MNQKTGGNILTKMDPVSRKERGETTNMSTSIDTQKATDRIVNAVTSLVGHLQQKPEKANTQFKVRASLNEGVLAKIAIRDFELISDEPASLGGTNKGPNPVELVLGALAACQEIVISAYAAVLGVKIDGVDIEVKGDIDLRGFLNVAEVRPGYNNVEFSTTIKTSETDRVKLDQLIQFAEKKCPVYDIIANPVKVSGSFKVEAVN